MKKNIMEEQSYLDKTLLRFNETLKEYDDALKGYYKLYDDNPLLYSSLIETGRHKINSINKSLSKPYFARIDFTENNEEMECYISKVGIFDTDNNPITIDWRAPIASLYYDGNLGAAQYEAPEGVIKGNLTLKRQYEIKDKKIQTFQDVDTVTNDELLKPYLSASNDNRLKNIVSTIQAEQNAIIRENLYDNMVIQGVAGSGKTTVALHRIAYLEYNYRDKYKSTDYLVIGPNKYFVKYISGVLPDLDVFDTPQVTYEDLFNNIIKNTIKVKSDNENLKSAINGYDLNKEKYKLSLNYKDDIDKYLNEFIKYFIKDDFAINGFKILNKNIIQKYYDEASSEILSEKIERTILLLKTYIKKEYNAIQNNIQKAFFDHPNKESYQKTMKSLKGLFIKELRNYFNLRSINIINLYKDISKENTFESEDYPGLLYTYYRIFGIHKYDNIKHTVIDEAQDYGTFNFYVLKKILPNSTFSIYGDLAQSLYSFHSINSWDELNKVFPDLKIRYLNKSYRTTTEILEYANKINRHLGLNEATPVIRHGSAVETIKYEKNIFLNKLHEYYQKGYGEIGIIIKTDDEYNEVKNLTKDLKYNLNIITSYNAKGLEFDAVIIYNADESLYSASNELDMKLLYVSLTRALHELTVYYHSDVTSVLK